MAPKSNGKNVPKVAGKTRNRTSAASTAKKPFNEMTWEEKCAKSPYLNPNRHRKAAMSTGGTAPRKTSRPPKKEEPSAKTATRQSSYSKSEGDLDKQPSVSNLVGERKTPDILNDDNNGHASNAIVSDGIAYHDGKQIVVQNSSNNAYSKVLRSRRRTLTYEHKVAGWLAANVEMEDKSN